ncbi:MAG: hypothetical protein M3156_05670 [Thermoproteota archaeon]|nr:hypothetical protein [Thermoproteota archaeon]
MSAYNMYLSFNRFEMSIVGILAKKRDAVRISSLVEGFPDYYLEQVLLAISNLNYRGYILFSDLNTPHIRVYLNQEKREEVLKIIDPLPNLTLAKDIRSHHNNTERVVKPLIIRSIAVFSLIFFGFIITLDIAEFSGENRAANVAYDRHLLKNHDFERPVKYQWHFDKGYYRETNSSLPTSFTPPSHFWHALYPCSYERNLSS